MLKGVQEYTDITALIKGILNGYPGNSAIFREYLQNSDDARATSQFFILDERSYSTDSVVDPALRETQGPALIAVNNGLLRDVDWTALRKINSSSKGSDETQTGKNGLGFRASYHLTENPHILSGKSLMILDPHHAFAENYKGGIFMDPIETFAATYQDQFAPFRFLLDNTESPFRSFNGTAFRLPLRTEEQAKRSQIKDTATSVEEMRDALLDFAQKDLEQSILFLKNITRIQIRHIDASGVERTAITISAEALPSPLPTSCTRNITITKDGMSTTRTWLITHHATSRDVAKGVLSERLGYDIGDALVKDKLVANVELVIPRDGTPIDGRLFTLLPLPQLTNFPVHLNAVFALTTDRQGLKNMHEVGLPKSRERRLVEWNRTIFDTWAPEAWADMLEHMPADILSSASWDLWPPEEHGESCYWAGLCNRLVSIVLSRGLRVFPARPYEMQTDLVALHDPNILIASSNPGVNLEILSELGIRIIQPPPHIYDIFSADDALASHLLAPESLHRILCNIPRESINCDREKLHAVMDYLVFSDSPPAMRLIAGLQWFYLANAYPAAVELPSNNPRLLVPSSENEARIFQNLSNMLAWNSFSARLREQLSDPSAARALNVGVLSTSDVFTYLSEKFRFPGSDSEEVPGFQVDWVVNFWSWVIGWPNQREFFEQVDSISNIFLLPTARGRLRKLISGAISFADTDPSVIEAWNTLGVFSLHPGLQENVVLKLRQVHRVFVPRQKQYIRHLIRTCEVSPQGVGEERAKEAFEKIRSSLYEDLPRNAVIDLSSQEREKLTSFPIFHVRTGAGRASILKPAIGKRVYVQVDDAFPLPVLQSSEIYVDVRDTVTLQLATLLENGRPGISSRFDLLQLAANDWQIQSTTNQDLFADYALQNWGKLPHSLRSAFERLPFVTVNDQPERRPPKDLIHPGSQLKELYIGEAGRMPAGRFAEQEYLIIMQSRGFLHADLDNFVVKDRLDYLSTAKTNQDPHLHQKASTFIRILDLHWKHQYSPLLLPYRDHQWLPHPTEASQLISPNKCRDGHYDLHSNPYYYDLVWDVLKIDLLSSDLRTALGWCDAVPSSILIDQYRHTLDQAEGRQRNERLVVLLQYIDQLHCNSELLDEALPALRSLGTNRSWIPIADSRHETVTAKHALLSNCRLRAPFRHVDARLKDLKILQQMGCTTRPSFDTLRSELVSQPPDAPDVPAVIAILEEIGDHHDRACYQEAILVPGEDCRLRSLDSVYFRDMNFAPLSSTISSMAATHERMSRKLAETLGIQMLSSVALGEIDVDEEQMSEDLVTRIRGFLRDFDPRYAINEFLANADDAGANEFNIYLTAHDRRTGTQEKVISPQFHSLLSSPSLLLYNNARLSEEDFAGLRRVGQGGKLELTETHGRHGLGALSLYYFTDVVTVISGEYVMILDPSGKFLPPLMNGGKRTALKRPIIDILSQYPDQLKACEPFGVSRATLVFPGTLFFLPLHATISKKACDYTMTREFIQGSYWDLAQKAFFFTRMESISAKEIMAGKFHPLWEVSARRSSVHALGENFSLYTLQVKPKGAVKAEETWFVTTSEGQTIPVEYEATATEMKLSPGSKMKVQLAINPQLFQGDTEKPAEMFPFSTMALPRAISLPFHLNARFAISSNRQGLVLNSADSRNNLDRKTAFNTWVLETIVPPLYLATLEHLIHNDDTFKDHSSKDPRWWLLKCADETSKITQTGFFQALSHADNRLFQSADAQWIPFRDAVFSKDELSDVRGILNFIEARNYVPISRRARLYSIPGAKSVEPEFVKQALLQSSTALDTLRLRLLSNDLNETDVYKTLNYIQPAGSLGGLPLLLLADGQLIKVPAQDEDAVYIPEDRSHCILFPSSSFVRMADPPNGYSTATLDCVDEDDSVNVATIGDDDVPILAERELDRLEDDQRVEWVRKFWKAYFSLPGPPSLVKLEESQVPLVETLAGLLPLSHCLPKKVVYVSDRAASLAWFGPALRQMGIVVVGTNDVLEEYFTKRFPDLLDNVLRCISAKGVGVFSNLGREEHSQLAQWIKDQMAGRFLKSSSGSWYSQCPVSKGFLLSLPIWEIFTNGTAQLASAFNVKILPYRFHVERIQPFLKADTSIAPFSSILADFVKFCKGMKYQASPALTCAGVWSSVVVPDRITQLTEVQRWKDFIWEVLNFPDSDVHALDLRIPDREGVLRPVSQFYDESVELFSQSFRLQASPPFVHAEFRSMVHALRGYGLVHEITISTFRACATAIQDSIPTAASDPVRLHALREISEVAFRVYQDGLPSQIMTNTTAWESLNDIAFIVPEHQRRRGTSFDVNVYVSEPLPVLVSPSRFVRRHFEPIAWTQRALFLLEPAEGILAVNKKLGVPTAQEVVAHLKVLTTRIAIEHERHSGVLSDIKATYKWLNDHHEKAREYLLAAEDDKLFLNVMDPSSDAWADQWVSAKDLVINLEFDTGSKRYLRNFLKGYENLLLAAGCSSLTVDGDFGYGAAGGRGPRVGSVDAVLDKYVQIWSTFNEMREKGELTDVVLVPQGQEKVTDEDDPMHGRVVDPSELRAHGHLLAASIPYLRASLDKHWSQNGEIKFFGTAVGAKALLDFIYTGEMGISQHTTNDPDELAVLQRDLLELLSTADEWQMEDFKEKLQWEIMHKHKMITRLPHTLSIMLEQAKLCHAEKLETALDRFRQSNEDFLLRDLQGS